MRGNAKERAQARNARSVFEIITEDGAMRPKKILHIVQQLCRLLAGEHDSQATWVSGYLHPKNILVHDNGTVQLSNKNIPLSAMEAYIPPEQDQFDRITPASTVYALGMVMLFMATGQEKKADLDVFVEDGTLRALIARCTAFDPRARFQDIGALLDATKRTRAVVKRLSLACLLLVCAGAVLMLLLRLFQTGSARGESAGREAGYAAGYAYGYEKGFADAPGIGIRGASFDPQNGNLSGNLAAKSGAIAAYSGEEVFFLHGGSIYRMNPYTEATELLVANAGTYGLNYYNGWLYYGTDEDVRKIRPQTMEEEVFCASRTGRLYIVEGVFYLHDTFGTGYLYRIDESNGALTQLNDMTAYHCLNIVGDALYFIDADKGNNLYRCDLDEGNLQLISSSHCESFCIYDGKIYTYAASFEGNALHYPASFLACMDLQGGSVERFTNVPAYHPNVTDGGIFYVAGNNRTLTWMSHNGRTQYTILPSRTGDFNIAGGWIFYLNEEDGGALWRVRIDGSCNAKIVL